MEGSLRKLIPLFLLAMWVVFYQLLSRDLVAVSFAYLLLLTHVICLLVFVNFVYVFNYGYALCVLLLNGIIFFSTGASGPIALALILAMAYGLRLLLFTQQRLQSDSYKPTQAAIDDTSQAMPAFVKVLIWVFVSWNQLFYCLPLYLLAHKAQFSAWIYPGIALMLIGLLLESLADWQKQRFKAIHPQQFCNIGLFRLCRHPNYLGEIVFIVGLYMAAASSFSAWYEYLAGCISPLYLFLLMLDAASRGDVSQRQTYADNPAYIDYAGRVPSLWPRLPG